MKRTFEAGGLPETYEEKSLKFFLQKLETMIQSLPAERQAVLAGRIEELLTEFSPRALNQSGNADKNLRPMLESEVQPESFEKVRASLLNFVQEQAPLELLPGEEWYTAARRTAEALKQAGFNARLIVGGLTRHCELPVVDVNGEQSIIIIPRGIHSTAVANICHFSGKRGNNMVVGQIQDLPWMAKQRLAILLGEKECQDLIFKEASSYQPPQAEYGKVVLEKSRF